MCVVCHHDVYQLLKAGCLGKKSGMGFYLHATDGKKEKGDKQINPKAVEILKKHVKQDLKLSKVRRAL